MNKKDTRSANRYYDVTTEKADGAVYTPRILADFVSHKMLNAAQPWNSKNLPLRILDPAIGHGELLVSFLEILANKKNNRD